MAQTGVKSTPQNNRDRKIRAKEKTLDLFWKIEIVRIISSLILCNILLNDRLNGTSFSWFHLLLLVRTHYGLFRKVTKWLTFLTQIITTDIKIVFRKFQQFVGLTHSPKIFIVDHISSEQRISSSGKGLANSLFLFSVLDKSSPALAITSTSFLVQGSERLV